MEAEGTLETLITTSTRDAGQTEEEKESHQEVCAGTFACFRIDSVATYFKLRFCLFLTCCSLQVVCTVVITVWLLFRIVCNVLRDAEMSDHCTRVNFVRKRQSEVHGQTVVC